jgi:hypothetical protein
MKKFGMAMILFLALCAGVFAYENRGEADVPLMPRQPPVHYYFYSVDLNNPADILYFGFASGSGGLYAPAGQYFANNMGLSQAVKEQMRRQRANVCATEPGDGNMYINIQKQNGQYDTFVYPAKQQQQQGGNRRGR